MKKRPESGSLAKGGVTGPMENERGEFFEAQTNAKGWSQRCDDYHRSREESTGRES